MRQKQSPFPRRRGERVLCDKNKRVLCESNSVVFVVLQTLSFLSLMDDANKVRKTYGYMCVTLRRVRAQHPRTHSTTSRAPCTRTFVESLVLTIDDSPSTLSRAKAACDRDANAKFASTARAGVTEFPTSAHAKTTISRLEVVETTKNSHERAFVTSTIARAREVICDDECELAWRHKSSIIALGDASRSHRRRDGRSVDRIWCRRRGTTSSSSSSSSKSSSSSSKSSSSSSSFNHPSNHVSRDVLRHRAMVLE